MRRGDDVPQDGDLDAALAEFTEACLAGRRPDREAFCAERPALRERLRPLLDPIDEAAEGLRAAFARGDEGRLPSPAAAPACGARFGDFELVREIGRGGMGVVYEAVQQPLGRRVALKLLATHLTARPAAVERFRREAQLVARLDHRGIVRVHAFASIGESHCFAMELVDGVPLDVLIERARDGGPSIRGAIDVARPGTAARLALELAEALAHAHAAGVVHRDVKPSNVLVRRDGSAVLTDFGLARDDELAGLTQAGEFPGTAEYAAPEQIAGVRERVGPRCDLWSLGATLYELLTLRRPFVGRTLHEVRERVLRDEPPPPRRLRPDLPDDLATIVMRCLEKEPERRYSDLEALAADLAAFLDFRPIAARRAGWIERVAQRVRRRPIELGVVPALAVVAATALGWALLARSAASAREWQRATDQLAFEAREHLGRREHAEFAERARRLMARSGDPHAIASHLLGVATALEEQLLLTAAARLTTRAVERAERADDEELLGLARVKHLDALLCSGRYEEAIALASANPSLDAGRGGVIAGLIGPHVARIAIGPDARVAQPGMPWCGRFGRSASIALLIDHEGTGRATRLARTISGRFEAHPVEYAAHGARIVGLVDGDGDGALELAVVRPGNPCALDVVGIGAGDKAESRFHAEFASRAPLESFGIECVIAADLDDRPGREVIVATQAVDRRILAWSGEAEGRFPADGSAPFELDSSLARDATDVRALATFACEDGEGSDLLVATGFHHGFDVRALEWPRGTATEGIPQWRAKVGQATGLLDGAPFGLPHGTLLVAVSDTPEREKELAGLVSRRCLPGGLFAVVPGGPEGARLLDAPYLSLGDLAGARATGDAKLGRWFAAQRRGNVAVAVGRLEIAAGPPCAPADPVGSIAIAELASSSRRLAWLPVESGAVGDLDGDGDDEIVVVQQEQVVVLGLRDAEPDAPPIAARAGFAPSSLASRLDAAVAEELAGSPPSTDRARLLRLVEHFVPGKPTSLTALLDLARGRSTSLAAVPDATIHREGAMLLIDRPSVRDAPPVARGVDLDAVAVGRPFRCRLALRIDRMQYGTLVEIGCFEGSETDRKSAGTVRLELGRAPRRPTDDFHRTSWQPGTGVVVAHAAAVNPEFGENVDYLVEIVAIPAEGLRAVHVRRADAELDGAPLLAAVELGTPGAVDPTTWIGVRGTCSDRADGGRAVVEVGAIVVDLLADP